VGFFSEAGVLTTRLAGRDLTRLWLPSRLDTQFVRDFPRRMATLTVGDAVSAPAPWARQVHYGGIRWASKFSTQPAFIPFAIPVLAGQAAQPSTVDIYVDNVRTTQQSIDTGPFSVRNMPVITGQGEIRMVVTDILGHQQVITRPYIRARELLRKGVNEYTYEAGSLRRGFGTSSSGYGSFFLAGTHRRGLTDTLTLSWRGEILAAHQTFGIGLDGALLPLGLLGGGIALSHADIGLGALLYGLLQHRSRSFGYSASVQVASSQFRQLGTVSDERPPEVLAQVQVSRALGNRGSVAFGFLRQQHHDNRLRQNERAKTDLSAFIASLAFRLAGRAFLSISTN
jgi:outer membrane usher protein